jgi:integrase/recombinase XerD
MSTHHQPIITRLSPYRHPVVIFFILAEIASPAQFNEQEQPNPIQEHIMEQKIATSIVVAGRPIPDSLTRPVGDFLKHLEAAGLSPASVDKRRTDLLCLQNFLCDVGTVNPRDVTAQTLEDFLTRLRQLGYSHHTIESAVTSFRRLFAWLEDQAILFENPARRIKITYARKKLGLVLTPAQVDRLLSQPDTATTKGLRERAILEVLYATAMRLSECAGLSLFDIDLSNRTVKVHGKGSKDRLLPLGKQASRYLVLYLEHSRSRLTQRACASKDTHNLWLSYTGAPLGKQTIQKMIKHYSHTAKIPDETDTHTLRRTCATHLLQGGAHPIMVSQLLGHVDIKSLSHYLKTTITDLMAAHAKTNPGK